jgi:F-type H+-transporting ATPase subunit a
LSLLARVLLNQDPHNTAEASKEVIHSVAAAGEHVPTGGEIFTHLYHHVVAQPTHTIAVAKDSIWAKFAIDVEGELRLPVFFNLQYFQIGALVLIFALFYWALLGLKSGRPNRVQRTLSGFVLWVRDDMAVPSLGTHLAHSMLPFFLSMFFFVAASNLIGLFPFGVTATSCIFVTAGMAMVTFATMVVGGMIANGPVKFWLGLVPHGVPWFMWPIMFPVEIISLLVKPFALTIRLFANMTGGHLVVLSFTGLIFYFAEKIGNVGYAIAVPAVAFSVFIMIIEAFVALLQAYIFTLLSMLFIGASIHPEH